VDIFPHEHLQIREFFFKSKLSSIYPAPSFFVYRAIAARSVCGVGTQATLHGQDPAPHMIGRPFLVPMAGPRPRCPPGPPPRGGALCPPWPSPPPSPRKARGKSLREDCVVFFHGVVKGGGELALKRSWLCIIFSHPEYAILARTSHLGRGPLVFPGEDKQDATHRNTQEPTRGTGARKQPGTGAVNKRDG